MARFLLELLWEVSGLKMNFHKSVLAGILVEDHLLGRVALILGCQVGTFPLSYLGLPLSGGPTLCRNSQCIIQKFQKFEKGWQDERGGSCLMVGSLFGVD